MAWPTPLFFEGLLALALGALLLVLLWMIVRLLRPRARAARG